jgi:hypothetical protein
MVFKKNQKKKPKQNKIYSKINIDKGYLPSSIYVDRGGNIGLYKFLFNMINGTYYNMNITILTLSSQLYHNINITHSTYQNSNSKTLYRFK